MQLLTPQLAQHVESACTTRIPVFCPGALCRKGGSLHCVWGAYRPTRIIIEWGDLYSDFEHTFAVNAQTFENSGRQPGFPQFVALQG
jgi:hypothetical protein